MYGRAYNPARYAIHQTPVNMYKIYRKTITKTMGKVWKIYEKYIQNIYKIYGKRMKNVWNT